MRNGWEWLIKFANDMINNMMIRLTFYKFQISKYHNVITLLSTKINPFKLNE